MSEHETSHSAEKDVTWRCPRCHRTRWVAASLTRGITVIPQCVPCGKYDGRYRVTPEGTLVLPAGKDGS